MILIKESKNNLRKQVKIFFKEPPRNIFSSKDALKKLPGKKF